MRTVLLTCLGASLLTAGFFVCRAWLRGKAAGNITHPDVHLTDEPLPGPRKQKH